jgi:hypothetical protein
MIRAYRLYNDPDGNSMSCVVALVKVNWLKPRPFFLRKRRPIHPMTDTMILSLNT